MSTLVTGSASLINSYYMLHRSVRSNESVIVIDKFACVGGGLQSLTIVR